MTGSGLIVSGHQPDFHAYLGIAAKMIDCQVFALADDMAFSRTKFHRRQRFRRGRNASEYWLWVPVQRDLVRTPIGRKVIEGSEWKRLHLRSLDDSLGNYEYYDLIRAAIDPIYSSQWRYLGDFNCALFCATMRLAFPQTEFVRSSELGLRGWLGKGLRIADELSLLSPGGGTYLSGAASAYLLEPSVDPTVPHIQYIWDQGFRVVRATIERSVWKEATPVPYAASTLEALAFHGPGELVKLLRLAVRHEEMR